MNKNFTKVYNIKIVLKLPRISSQLTVVDEGMVTSSNSGYNTRTMITIRMIDDDDDDE